MFNPKMLLIYALSTCLMLSRASGLPAVSGQDIGVEREAVADTHLYPNGLSHKWGLEEEGLQQIEADRHAIGLQTVPLALLEQTNVAALALIQTSQLFQDQRDSGKQETGKQDPAKLLKRNRTKGVESIRAKFNVNDQAVGRRNVEIRAYGGNIQLRTFGFSSNDSPSQNRQVIVEMKKGTGAKNERIIRGVFADESWIDSRTGAIQFYNSNESLGPSTVNQFWIGVRCSEVPAVQSSNGELDVVLEVKDVVPESAASEAGIKVQDVILAWNEKQLKTIPELVAEIQANQSNLATVSLIRDGRKLDVQLRPKARTFGATKIHTIFAPSTELEVAEERIGQLKEMILAKDVDKDQLFRFVVVGPGVNFGQGEIELQLKPDLQNQRGKLTQMIDRVAEKKFSVMFRDDNVRLLDSAELDLNFDMDELVPEQIWQSFDIGSNGRSLSFSMIAPQVLSPELDNTRIKTSRVQRIRRNSIPNNAINGIDDFTVGRLIFESPHQEINIEQILMKERELRELRFEVEKMSNENKNLKAEIKALKVLLKSQK